MAPPPAEVAQWLKRTYPQPTVDPEWLEGCYTWIQDELHLNPARDMPTILENVNTQLLESNLTDSMVEGTGIPPNVLGAVHAVIKGPILVEVIDMTDIGHSAYSLMQVYESRAEYLKQADLRNANGDEEQRKPIPKYPRSMLHFQLSDGASVLPAVEHNSLPQFELGETPLGYKMVLKNVTVRRGTALLEPKCVEVKGHRTADLDEKREQTLLRALRRRMKEDDPVDEPPEANAQPGPAPAPPPAPAPAPAPGPATVPAQSTPSPLVRSNNRSPTRAPRSPLHRIRLPRESRAGPSNAAPLNMLEHADDADEPRRRKLPSRVGRSPSPGPPPREQMLQRSRYFSTPEEASAAHGGASSSDQVTLRGPGTEDAMKAFARKIGLSPPRSSPVEIPVSDEEEAHSYGSVPVQTAVQTGIQDSKQKQKQKQRQESREGTPDASSEDFGSEFQMDASFFEEVDRVTEKAHKCTNGSQTQVQTQTQVKIEVQSQVTSATLVGSVGVATTSRSATARGSSMSRTTPAPGSRAASVPGTSLTQLKGQSDGGDREIIDIDDDDEDVEKENVPVPTRHIRRRIALQADDVIELSD